MSLSAEADIDENRHIIMMNFSLVSDAAIKNVVIEMSYNFVFFWPQQIRNLVKEIVICESQNRGSKGTVAPWQAILQTKCQQNRKLAKEPTIHIFWKM